MESPRIRIGFAALTALLVAAGCHVEREVVSPPPSAGSGGGAAAIPRPTGPRDVRIADRLGVGASVGHRFTGEEGVAVGYVTAARTGAEIGLALQAEPTSELFVYGPVGADGWSAAPLLGRGGGDGELRFTAPRDGTYLVAVLGPGDASGAFTLTTRCASGAEATACRVECGPGGACPTGAQCALVQCIRAPCPSYCQAMPPLPPGAGAPPSEPSEPAPPTSGGGVGATCGTRGAAPCAEGLFCLYPVEAACGETDRPGTCQEPPRVCTREYRPVCGCDGRTYGNACSAHGAGTSVRADGPCPGDAR